MRISEKAVAPKWLLVIAFFIAGIFLGALGSYLWLNISSPLLRKIHPATGSYKFTNPLVAVDIYENKQFARNKALELELDGLINENKRDKSVSEVAVYFRDIEPGLWVGIDEEAKFSPGKLLKIPIMIAYFKLAESNPEILNEHISYYGGLVGNKEISATPGETLTKVDYTVDDLIKKMIVGYDDFSAKLLFDKIDKSSLNEVFSDLGIDFKEDKETTDFISLKLYSLFFRVLYNATYLNRDYSERALQLISESVVGGYGISAGLPKDLLVADRSGGRVYEKSGRKFFEIYDCGITYYPSHPYLLCAVVKGKNSDNIKKFLKELGQTVYQEMSYEYRE